MSAHCGHLCCAIATNGYHVHQAPPGLCRRCASAAIAAGEPVESIIIGRVVASVMTHIATQIPGLPEGQDLAELVTTTALQVFADGLVDPDIQTLDEWEQRSVLAARVGLELAFFNYR